MSSHIDKRILDFLVRNELLNDPFEALSALDHVHNQASLVVSVLLQHMLIKLDPASSNSNQEGVIASMLLDVASFSSNQVESALDLFDREFNVELLDIRRDSFINLVSFSRLEFDWCIREQVFTLLI